MRELKFRAWDGERYLCDGEWHMTVDGKPITYDEEDGYVWDVHLTVEQYTGLKDKNGKDIYEGDILESTWNGDKAVVVWNNVEGEWEHYADFNAHSKYGSSIVIGNIHENPELLEEEE